MRVLSAGLLFVTTLLLGGAASALPADTWLVAIGNNRGDGEEVQLLYAERDARELSEALRGQGPIASDRVRLILDEDADTVRRALLAVNAAIRGAASQGERPPTALVIFYSGHADASALHLRGTHLGLDELRSLVQGSAAAMRLLIVDACRSGAVTRVKGVRPAPEFSLRLEDRIEAEGVATITSSTAGESSQESDRLRASFFSHHLLNALRGAADRNGDGRVTLSEAYDYTYGQTLRSSGRTLSLQHPTYAYDVKGSGELVLTRLADAGRGAGRLRLGEATTYLISEEREGGAVVAEVTPPRDRALLSLPRGRYFVQQRRREEYREFQVSLAVGEDVALEGLPYRPVRYDRLVRKRGAARESIHGLGALVAVRGEVLAGEGPTANLSLGYQLDAPWFTAGARLRGATVSSTAVDGTLPRRHSDLGLGLTAQRVVDLPWLSLSFGILIEGLWHLQELPGALRSSFGLGFGALIGVERHLVRGLGLRLEGGPLALLLRRGDTAGGALSGEGLGAVITYSAGGGLLWRL